MGRLFVAFAALCSVNFVCAQWNDDAKKCFEITGNPDLQIKHCTSAIASGQLSNPNLAVTLYNRGAAWLTKSDLTHTFEDFDAALKLDPKLASALLGRGQVNFIQGHFEPAASDLEQSQRLEPDAYAAIWLFLARARNGQDGTTELNTNIKTLKGDKWPTPILAMLSGKMTADAVQGKAHDSNSKVMSAQQCEANFYIGQWLLTKKNSTQARARLQQAADKCPKSFIEFVAASAEIKRLK
jgi:lipoprotein NlpI